MGLPSAMGKRETGTGWKNLFRYHSPCDNLHAKRTCGTAAVLTRCTCRYAVIKGRLHCRGQEAKGTKELLSIWVN